MNKIGMLLLEGVQVIGVSAVIIALLNVFVITPQEVRGLSMYPYLNDGDRLITEKISYSFNEPKRGDVVVFHFPLDRTQDYIKRLIALPGEEIELRNNTITIYNEQNPNGLLIEEDYLSADVITNARAFMKEGEKIKVPEGKYVVFGDNRENSSDSRQWGFVEKRDLVGKAIIRYWPPQSFGLIESAAANY